MTEPDSTFAYQFFKNGFFSEVNNMLLGILYCRLTHKRFVLSSRYSPYFHRTGWQDYFEPFSPEIASPVLHFLDSRPFGSAMTIRVLAKRLRRLLLLRIFQPLFFPHFEVMCTSWDALRSLREHAAFDLSIGGVQRRYSLRDALRAVHNGIWRYNGETRAQIGATITQLAMPPRYAALHVRRGDKYTEADHTDEIEYVDRLEQVTSLQDVYVSTDDHSCVENIQRMRPQWRVAFLCPENMRGHFHAEFRRKPAEERKAESVRLLTETEILKSAEVFVGSFSSNVGIYQGIARENHTYAVDSADWSFA